MAIALECSPEVWLEATEGERARAHPLVCVRVCARVLYKVEAEEQSSCGRTY